MGMTQMELEIAHSTLRKNNAIADSLEIINWEQRRYETASAVMVAMLKNGGQQLSAKSTRKIVKDALYCTDMFLKELKKEEHEEEG